MTVFDWIVLSVTGIVSCFALGVLIGYSFADMFIYFWDKLKK